MGLRHKENASHVVILFLGVGERLTWIEKITIEDDDGNVMDKRNYALRKHQIMEIGFPSWVVWV